MRNQGIIGKLRVTTMSLQSLLPVSGTIELPLLTPKERKRQVEVIRRAVLRLDQLETALQGKTR